jgi:hypothetical protein
MERYELRTIGTVATGTVPTGNREVPTLIQVATINLQTTPPTVTGAPFIIPFEGIMRRLPTGQERDISLETSYLSAWALCTAAQKNL